MAKQRLSLRVKLARTEEGIEIWYEGSLGHSEFSEASVHKVAKLELGEALEAKALELLEASEAAFDLEHGVPAEEE